MRRTCIFRGFSPRDESGYALIAAIGLCLTISLLAVVLMGYARTTSSTASIYADGIDSRLAAEAGLTRIVAAYASRGDELRQALSPDGAAVIWKYHDRTLNLSVEAESGKLDVNAGNLQHIENLVSRVITDSQVRHRVVSAIAAARSQKREILSVSELLSPFQRLTAMRDLLEAYLTVYTRQIGVDLYTAPRAVIEAIPGISAQGAADVLAARGAGTTGPGIPPELRRYFVPQRPTYALRSETGPEFKIGTAMRAVVHFAAGKEPLVLEWRSVRRREPTSGTSAPYPTSGVLSRL